MGAWIVLAELYDLACKILGAEMQQGSFMGDTGHLEQGGVITDLPAIATGWVVWSQIHRG